MPEGWADDVSIEIDDAGSISAVETGVAAAAAAGGCALPGIANLHSHAHQRAMAGLAERAGDASDSFWTWRTTMYGFLDSIEPHQLYAIAAQLYVEMLKAGYTRVAEFQYLHHQKDGSHYDNIAEMSLQTLAAANDVGLGITNVPVYYQFGGFDCAPISDQQRRFANDPHNILSIVKLLQEQGRNDPNVITAVAAHSLRAISKQGLAEVLAGADALGAKPVHIHIAEQIREVDECINWSGVRPVDYLLDNFDVDANWSLIHATHMTEGETTRLANSGAVAGICPTTEGNLGDGLFNAKPYLQQGGKLGIGSDSHISVSPVEELRWFEYGQRLIHHTRNQLSGGPQRSTGRNLFEVATAGGAQACGHNSGAIAVGKRADFIVLDITKPLLCERSGDEILDSWIFSGNDNVVRDVYVGGARVIENGHHYFESKINQRFQATLRELTASL